MSPTSPKETSFAKTRGVRSFTRIRLVTVLDADDLVVVETADAVLVVPRVMERTG